MSITEATATKADRSAELIHALNTEYGRALSAARLLREMTDTAAWQAQYGLIQSQNAATRAEYAARLAEINRTAAYGWGDDERKALKDIAKESEASEDQYRHIIDGMVMPIRQVVDECRIVLDRHVSKAKDIANREPMFAGQILQEMEDAIAGMPKVQWETESGRVMIIE